MNIYVYVYSIISEDPPYSRIQIGINFAVLSKPISVNTDAPMTFQLFDLTRKSYLEFWSIFSELEYIFLRKTT